MQSILWGLGLRNWKTFIKCNEPIECIYVNLFGPTEWFGTPTWPPRSHVKMLLRILRLKQSLNLANLGTFGFIKLTWFIANCILMAWHGLQKNIHQMQGEIMHLCKSICAKRVVWYTNMASEKSGENAFKDISNSEFGAVSFTKQETKTKSRE